MKKLYNYIMLFIMAFAVASCADDEVITNKVLGQTGDEVQFGLSLENGSRTVYGDEAGNAFPIYWVNGDKVQIFSPQCLEGRRNAEYEVILPTKLPEGKLGPDYADKLEKIGDYGVQWGTDETADFYSLYPSGQYKLSSDGSQAQNIRINYSQNVLIGDNGVKSDMEDCLMYASAKGVSKGSTVELQYKPISSVLWITLNVENKASEDLVIQSISVDAGKTNIAGEFSLNITDGSFAGWGTDKSSIVAAQIFDSATGGLYSVPKESTRTIEIPLFFAPVEDLNTNGWKIKVVANGVEKVKSLGALTIESGMIHKVSLPTLSTTASTWDVSKWMTYIPRNVYLSEVSIPGTWNSLNSDFQLDRSISNQYAIGVRAFHIDTRWKRTGYSWIVGNNYKYSLGTADGGGTSSLTDGKFMTDEDNPTFESSLKAITDKVQSDEYMVLFCTFAQKSNNHVENGNYWYDEISRICAENDKVYDASTLTKNTLVGDVLGHVIVVVNLASSVSSVELPENSRCLFTYVPMELPSDHYATTTSHTDALYYGSKSTSGISMYTSHAQISTTKTSAVNCGDRGYSHPLTSRDNLVTSFWDWSESNYGTTNYNHDKWIYLGLGGYILDSTNADESGYETIENRYASMVYNRIDKMGKNNVPFYPVGIILMNNKKGSNYTDGTTDLKYGFSDICKQILLLNNKYRLQYDPSKPSDYDPNYVQSGTGDNESEVEEEEA